jgi:hypothetical protein
VTETTFQTQNFTALQPVVTQQLATVDTGGFVAQQNVQPGDTTFRLRWQPSGSSFNAATGQTIFRRGGLGWVPFQSAPQVTTQLQYQPNIQTVAIPQTSFMPQTFQQQIPVQTTRMQSEMVQQQVPVQTMRMQTEVVQQQIPIQTTRMESQTVQQQIPIQTTRIQEEIVQQQVPVTVQRMQAVQERVMVPETVRKVVPKLIENKVEKKVVEWVPEQIVRPVTTTRESFKLETVVDEIPVRVQTMERYTEKVPVTKRVARRVAETKMMMVPRRVTTRVPLNFYDPYSAAISADYSSFSNVVDSAVVTASDSKQSASLPAPADAAVSDTKFEVRKIEVDKIKPSGTVENAQKSAESEELPAKSDGTLNLKLQD